jgi:hypothetical protein
MARVLYPAGIANSVVYQERGSLRSPKQAKGKAMKKAAVMMTDLTPAALRRSPGQTNGGKAMKKTAIMMTALTLAVLMSCDTGTGVDAKPDSGERAEVNFSTGISAARSVGRAVGTSWDSDDAIGIFMLERGGTGIVDSAANRQYSVSDAANGSFAPANRDATIYYPANQQGVDFIAYYPYASALQGFAYPVDVSDQTSQAKIDLMTAARVSIQGREPVALTFKHRLARLELEIIAGTNLTDADLRGLRAAITGQQTTGTYSISDNDLTPSGAGDRSIPLKMAANGKTGQGIILPGAAQEGRKFSFTLGFRQFSYTIPAEDAFRPGTKNKYTITLKRSAPLSSPDKEANISVESAFTAVIEDWGEGITGEGDAEEEGGSGNGGDSGGGTISNGSTRYKAEPVSGGYQVVSAYTDGMKKFVTVYLGKVRNAPIIWDQDGHWYRGAGYPNIAYTISVTKSESFTETQSATKLVSNSVSNTNSNEAGVEVGVGYKVESQVGAKAFGLSASVKASVEESLKGHWTYVSSSTAATTEELSQTFETAKTTFVEKAKAINFAFGQNNEAIGYSNPP